VSFSPRDEILAIFLLIFSANTNPYAKRLHSVNQGPRGHCLMKKKYRGSKISWHCPFKEFCRKFRITKCRLYFALRTFVCKFRKHFMTWRNAAEVPRNFSKLIRNILSRNFVTTLISEYNERSSLGWKIKEKSCVTKKRADRGAKLIFNPNPHCLGI
jgi:hypothetical protein